MTTTTTTGITIDTPPTTMPATSPSNPSSSDDELPRDTGTFRATHPELGGFLTQDGVPYQPSTYDDYDDDYSVDNTPAADQIEREEHPRRPFLTVVFTLLIVGLIATGLVSALVLSLGSATVGTADDLIGVLRTSLP